MKIAIIAMGLIGAGLVGALAAGVLFPAETADSEEPQEPSRLEERVASLEGALSRMTTEMSLLRTAVDRAASRPIAEVADVSATETVDSAGPADEVAAVPETELRDKIRDVVEQKEKEDREAREKRRAEMSAAFETRMLDRLEESLGLNSYQRDELTNIIAARRKAMTDIRAKYFGEGMERTPEAFAQFREEAQKAREEADSQLQVLLTTDQYETYKEQDRSFGRGGRGPGGGGFPGGGRGR